MFKSQKASVKSLCERCSTADKSLQALLCHHRPRGRSRTERPGACLGTMSPWQFKQGTGKITAAPKAGTLPTPSCNLVPGSLRPCT